MFFFLLEMLLPEAIRTCRQAKEGSNDGGAAHGQSHQQAALLSVPSTSQPVFSKVKNFGYNSTVTIKLFKSELVMNYKLL